MTRWTAALAAIVLAIAACGPDTDGPMGAPTPPQLQTPVPVDEGHPPEQVIPMPPEAPGTVVPMSPSPPPTLEAPP